MRSFRIAVSRSHVPLASAGLLLLGAMPARPQSPDPQEAVVPSNVTVISGYGTVGFAAVIQGESENRFDAAIAPIFLFQFRDRVLFEAELEFELEEGVTEVGLEYANVGYIVNDHLVLVGGKFLVPFGVFIDRLHPTWINKFSTMPPLYGHGMGPLGHPLVPILADVGVMAKAVTTAGPWQFVANAYVTQGPGFELEDGEMEVEFPASSEDNNKNKMVGGRLDFAHQQHAELNLSAFTGKYDDAGKLSFTGYNVAGSVHWRSFEARGEYLQTRQEMEELPGEVVTLRKRGYYAQGAYRVGAWEPVVRFTQVFDAEVEDVVETEGAWQLGLGLDYWISPSIAIMAGYEINNEKGPELDNDRVVVHLSFGF